MFEKFGELNSFGEINELAENLFNEGRHRVTESHGKGERNPE